LSLDYERWRVPSNECLAVPNNRSCHAAKVKIIFDPERGRREREEFSLAKPL
jgi:hypothetical protein